MAKWRLTHAGVLEYLRLGFYAAEDDILDATAAPDARWVLHSDQGAAETVTRHGLGSLNPFDGGEPGEHAVPDHLDGGTPTTTNFDLMDGGTP